MNINELREKRAKVWENTKSFLESHRSEKGTLSAADENPYNLPIYSQFLHFVIKHLLL